MLNIKLYTRRNLKSQGHGGDGKGDEKLGKTGIHLENSGRGWEDGEKEGIWEYKHHKEIGKI